MKTFLVIPGQNIPQHNAGCAWCLHQSVVLSRRWLTLLDEVLGGFIPLTGERLCLFSRSILWRVPLLWGFGADLEDFPPAAGLSPPPDTPSLSQLVYPNSRHFSPAAKVWDRARLRSRAACAAARGGCSGVWGDGVTRIGGCGMGLLAARALAPSDRGLHPPAPQSPPRQRGQAGEWPGLGLLIAPRCSLPGAEPRRPRSQGAWLLFLFSFAFLSVPHELGQ